MFPSYAELHCLTHFTFLRGASHPEELVERAVQFGYSALAITDECSLAGVVRAHVAAKERGLKLIVGAEFTLHEVESNNKSKRERRLPLTPALSRKGRGSCASCCWPAIVRATATSRS